jgi:predicted naringenin-chalcone synthase
VSLWIEGIGTGVPPYSATQEEAVTFAEERGPESDEERRQLRAIYRLSRVRTRRSVLLEPPGADGAARQSFFPPRRGPGDRGPATSERMRVYEQQAPGLAVSAARAALAQAGRDPAEITHLVTVSCTGFYAPGFDVQLMRQLGLPAATARTHLGFMGCHGAFHALRVARAFAGASAGACVLVCTVELCSLHFQYGWSPDLVVANALFGDGAAAVVAGGARRPGRDDWELAADACALLGDSADEMTWRIGDHGYVMTLSPRVPGLIQGSLRPWLDPWLAHQELGIADVASWAVHPGGPRILESCAEVTGTSRADHATAHEVLAEFGNMSSSTILFILERLRRRNAPRPCLAVGFGPGLSAEAALFR